MEEDNSSTANGNKSFWTSTIGTITKITALLTAITALIVAVDPYIKSFNNAGSREGSVNKPDNNTPSDTGSHGSDNTSNSPSESTGSQIDPTANGSEPPKKHDFSPPEVRDFLDAAVNGNIDILKKDLELGIGVDVTLNDDRTALGNAVLNNKPEAVKLLLAHHADPNVKVNGNSYLIIEASYAGYTEIVDLLIKHKADVNKRKQDGSGITPLMFACIQGNKDIVQKLIDANADANIKSWQGSTALDYANELASPLKEQIVAVLKNVGALPGH